MIGFNKLVCGFKYRECYAVVLAVCLAFLVGCHRGESQLIESAIKDLSSPSSDFYALRKAQRVILDHRDKALPLLAERWDETDSALARALMLHLIGEISPDKYQELLVSFVTRPRADFSTAKRYFHESALKQLSNESLAQLSTTYESASFTYLRPQQAECLRQIQGIIGELAQERAADAATNLRKRKQ